MTAISAASATESRDTANPFPDLPAIRGHDSGREPASPSGPTRRFPSPRFGDYSRSRFESRVAFGGPDEDEDAEVIATPTRQFSLLEITSGLPDDSRESDVVAAERKLRDLRARVMAAQSLVAATPGMADTLARNRSKAEWFHARFKITGKQLRCGVSEDNIANPGVLDGAEFS